MDATVVVYAGAFAPARRALEARLGSGALQVEPARSRRFLELDTIERTLERSGCSLRWSAAQGGGRLGWREGAGTEQEVSLPGPPAFAWQLGPGGLGATLARACGPRRLLALRQGEERRRLVRCLDERGKTVARLVVLQRRFRTPPDQGDWSGPEELVQAEPVRGFPDALAELTRALDQADGLRRVGEAALLARPAPVLPVPYDPPAAWPALDRGEPAARALRRVALRQLEVAEAQLDGLRADLDSEFLHDLRVAARRTRSLLAQLKGALAGGEADALREGLRWLGRTTGPLRDLDVLLLELHALEPELASGLGALVELLEERRRPAHAEVVAALGSEDLRALSATWRGWAQGAAPLEGPTFGDLLAGRLERLARRIRRAGERLGADAPADDLHALRIECKKLRYLLECAPAGIADPLRRRSVRALKALQEVLGEFNDARLQAAELEQLAPALAARDRLALLPLGRLVERCRARERAARSAFAERFGRFAARRARRDLEQLAAALRGREAGAS